MQNYYDELQKYRQKEQQIKNNLINYHNTLKITEQRKIELIEEENKINKKKIQLHKYQSKLDELSQYKQIFKYSILPSDIIILILLAIILIPPVSNIIVTIISEKYIALLAFFFTMSVVARIISVGHQAKKDIKKIKKELYCTYGNNNIKYLFHQNEQSYQKNIDNQRLVNNYIYSIQKKINNQETSLKALQAEIKNLTQVTDIILKTVCTDEEISQKIEINIPKKLQRTIDK